LFVIGNDQLEKIRSIQFQSFVQRTIRHLRERFPNRCEAMDDGALETLIQLASAKGEEWNVTSAYDIERLSECFLNHGADFAATEETAWARAILRRDDLSGRDKLTAIAFEEAFNTEAGQ
jgi:hypothetical protein